MCDRCNPDDDCTCDQLATLNRYGYHLIDAADTRGYWYARLPMSGQMPEKLELDYDLAMAQRTLREYGYK